MLRRMQKFSSPDTCESYRQAGTICRSGFRELRGGVKCTIIDNSKSNGKSFFTLHNNTEKFGQILFVLFIQVSTLRIILCCETPTGQINHRTTL